MKVIIYDAAEKSPIGQSWALGAEMLGKDAWVIPATSWEDLKRQTAKIPDVWLESVQIWSHGLPGNVVIGEETANNADAFNEIRHHLIKDGSYVWFRSCGVAARKFGQTYMRDAAEFFGCRVYAHTFNIGFIQSGLRHVDPGVEPDWDPNEGVRGLNKLWGSMPWRPKSGMCWQMEPWA